MIRLSMRGPFSLDPNIAPRERGTQELGGFIATINHRIVSVYLQRRSETTARRLDLFFWTYKTANYPFWVLLQESDFVRYTSSGCPLCGWSEIIIDYVSMRLNVWANLSSNTLHFCSFPTFNDTQSISLAL